jgi:hypothetical protein
MSPFWEKSTMSPQRGAIRKFSAIAGALGVTFLLAVILLKSKF